MRGVVKTSPILISLCDEVLLLGSMNTEGEMLSVLPLVCTAKAGGIDCERGPG